MPRFLSHRESISEAALDGERAVIARVRAGEELAFEELVLAHYAPMCSAALALLRSRDAVEDIVQDVLRKLWARRAEWEPRGPVRAYLLLATRHETLSVIRRLRRDRGLAGRIAERQAVSGLDAMPGMAHAEPAIDEALVTAELREAIHEAAKELPERCREVFLFRWNDGLRPTEIATRMGISIKTVEMQMTRALKAIRARLAEHGLP